MLRREREAVFGRQWQYAGALSQLARPGDYVVTETGRDSVLVVRNDSGELRAFVNACLHRGFPVCQRHGNAAQFECPFHGWIYDLDGELVSTAGVAALPNAGALPALHLATRGGLVFVAFEQPAGPLSAALGETPDAGTLRVACERSLDFEANWKLAFEHPLVVERAEGVIHPALTRVIDGGGHVIVNTLKPITTTRSRWTTTWLTADGLPPEAVTEWDRVLDAHLKRIEEVARAATAHGFRPDSLALDDPTVRPALDAYVTLFERV